MANTQYVHTSSLLKHGSVMVCLGMLLSLLGTLTATATHDEVGYVLSLVLTFACLLATCAHVGASRLPVLRRRKFSQFILVVALSASCWIIYGVVQTSSIDINPLAFAAGLYGLFWGGYYLRIAFQLRSYRFKSSLMCIAAGLTCAAGIILATWTGMSNLTALTAVACYITLIGIEIFLTAILVHRESLAERQLAIEPVPVEEAETGPVYAGGYYQLASSREN